MKKVQISCFSLFAAVMMFLSSCSEGDKKGAETDTTATVTPEPVNTIVTTPENMVLVMHKVADFNKWLVLYESHDSVRLANGLHNYVIGRGLTDTNTVLVAMKADDFARAKAFTQSGELKNAMKRGGVTSAPESHFVLVEWQDTVNVGNIPRVLTSFTLKDKDVWRKVFDEGQQERTENGLVLRNVGRDADNANQIKLVTAITDTAKAFAYYKSDAMKKRITDGGILGEPKRFIFTIVKRY